ncbi:MAG: acyltransferase family protein [Okeania sp. SIO3I5]|uniref:lysophospholipid acyltransferase family protein n=1 Tax=Okeania sp. SIO3I5 TaxID=2607805 RepID=UPI0013BAC4E0|nr:lysophospholipid acyltransferase family protein [Okeania sp. SIO3I5]NEQ39594.1 acyltransferase family protein [Okeania sp. SIO3I5]
MIANQQNIRKPYDGWSLDERDSEIIKLIMPLWEWFYHYYFRVQTDGWHHIPDEKILIVGSHNGGLASPDTSMFMYDWFKRFGPERLVYGLMHQNAWSVSTGASLAVQCGAVRAHPKMAIAAFQRNASVVVYPGGAADVFRPHSMRDKIYFAGRKGFIKLALREEVPIVPMISHGAHDTLIILADFYEQLKQLHEWGMPWLFDVDPEVFPVYIGWPWGLAIGPLPNFPFPVQIHTRVCAPIVFERYGRQAASDRAYVDACYQKVLTQMQQELDQLINFVGE